MTSPRLSSPRLASILRLLLPCAIAAGLLTPALADSREEPTHDAEPKEQPTDRRPSAWTLTTPLGFHERAMVDTLQYNYQRASVPSMASDAWASTGNLGGEGINLLWFRRPETGQFFFADALSHWLPDTRRQKFYNTYAPMTLVAYNWGGGSDTHQDRLQGTFAGNVNRRIGVGAFVDYIHSKGAYAHQAVKNFAFGFNAYYNSDHYEMQALYQQYNSLNQENGGITDPAYIRDPASLQGGVSKINSTSIPTNLSDAFNRLTGARFFTTQAWNLGYRLDPEPGDTTSRSRFIPHTKFVYSLEYRHDRHAFRDFKASEIKDFWRNTYLDPSWTSDVTTLNTVTNTLGVSMVEGFRKWAKFSLGAYASLEHRSFTLPCGQKDFALPANWPEGVTPLPQGVAIVKHHTQDILWVGGRLRKDRGTLLRYDADARFALSGAQVGDFDLAGNIETRLPALGDTLGISASASLRNSEAPWLMENYVGNNFAWRNSFSKTRSLKVQGRVELPRTGTRLEAGFENVRGLLYFDRESLPAQCGSPVTVFAASLTQPLRLGILHFDNSLTYQESSNLDALPLPRLTVYSNLYLQFTAFKVLHLQLGADCDYYTRYCGLGYQPALMAFHTDRSRNLGDYAFCNAYVNAKLYQTRFYVMVSHVNQGWFSSNYFPLPGYPSNPRRIQIGLSVDFKN